MINYELGTYVGDALVPARLEAVRTDRKSVV